ncbi:MAG: roadblock/LC7 domain-containing protein [Asgard group archaeon]|nr:roadblock/LC7 domain-containing protein [Asgard group archaeon]
MENESVNETAEKLLRKLMDRSGASDIILTTEEGLPCCSVHEHQGSINVEGTAALLIDTIKSISSLLKLQNPAEKDSFRHMNIRTENGCMLIARSENFTMAQKFVGKEKAQRAGLSVRAAKRTLREIEELFRIFFTH